MRIVPARVISTALFAAFLALAFVIGNTMLTVRGAPCLEIGAAPFPLLRCERLFAHWRRRYSAADVTGDVDAGRVDASDQSQCDRITGALAKTVRRSILQ